LKLKGIATVRFEIKTFSISSVCQIFFIVELLFIFASEKVFELRFMLNQ